jgi:predicted dienelactone hydrolase
MKTLVCAAVGAAVGWMSMVGVARADKKPGGEARVGVTTRVFHPTNMVRNWRGDPEKDLRCTVWYPAVESAVEVRQEIGPKDAAGKPEGAPLFEAGMAAPGAALAEAPGGAKSHGWPMVLLSHGTGGSAMQMAWLGTALARAGFIAVAVDHPGNNANGKLTPEGMALWWERATDLSQVLDGMLADEEFGKKIDQERVGAAGYSLGGYTVLELAGAQTDVSEMLALCKENADAAVCNVPEMRGMGTPEEILHAVRKTSAISLAQSADLFSDDRITAVFAIAPALAFTMTEESLRAIRMPLEMVVGEDDNIAPPRDNAAYVRNEVRGAKLTLLPHVGHYTFLDTCTAEGKKKQERYCEDSKEVDRDAVHARAAGMAVGFFERSLRGK